jgi:hypothetical protein
MSVRSINRIANVGSGTSTGGTKVFVAVTDEAAEVSPAYSARMRYEYVVPDVNPVSVIDVAVVVVTVTHVRPPSAERCTVYVGTPAATDACHVTTVDVCEGVT